MDLNSFDGQSPFIMPPIVDEAKPLFAVVMFIFLVWFFAGVHYRMHVEQHGFPPIYIDKLKSCIGRLFH